MNDHNKLVFVWGVESSGTRLVRNILVENGYAGTGVNELPHAHERWGDFAEDYRLPAPPDGKKVWRFSFPMGGQMPDALGLIHYAREQGYCPHVIVTLRSGIARNKSAADAPSRDNKIVIEAYSIIFAAIKETSVDCHISTYEELLLRGVMALNHVPWLADVQKLGFAIRDENAKHYEATDESG